MNSVVYCVDNNQNQIKMFLNSVKTLRQNSTIQNIYVITTSNLISSCHEYAKIEFKFNDELHNIKSTKKPSVTNFCFSRLFIPLIDELQDFEKVLYLDCDTEVVGDIDDIFNIDDGSEIMGVHEFHKNSIPSFEEYKKRVFDNINKHSKYDIFNNDIWINSGVIVINNRKIKMTDYKTRLYNMIELQNKCDFVNQDEDLINVSFKINGISNIYNSTPSEIIDNKKIIHYMCHYKNDLLSRI